MPSVVIENPVINSAFLEPMRHFRFTNDGISDQIAEGRRPSEYFVPIPPPKKKGAQPTYQTEWIEERKQSAVFINQVRDRVALWRRGGHQGVTHVTRDLLEHWTYPERERRLFFCQIEALETAIYLTEIAAKHDPWIETQLRRENETYNPGLYRIAFKMATGSGKTLVMAMLIAWQGLNKLAQPQDPRFSDAFFVVTPGITIRERLRVLLPNAEGNYYRLHDLVTPEQHRRLSGVAIHVANFHAFQRQDTVDAAALTKKVLAGRDGEPDRFKETPGQMVRRVLRDLQGKGNIVVLNDEAHHCYRDKPGEAPEHITAEERADAKKSVEAARVWLNGLLAVKKSAGIRAIYDLSATPFFLRGSGYSEGTLFPWVVSDFSLIDAIESGIVKVPRVPVSDDQMTGESPTYRDLWPRIRDALPKKGRSVDDRQEPNLPAELEGALRALYGHYEKVFKAEEQTRAFLDVTAGERLEALYVLAVTTGMRQGEILALRWRDMDLDHPSAQIQQSIQFLAGSRYVFTPPKTVKSRRKVELTKAAIVALRRHRTRQLEERFAASGGWEELDLVFANEVGLPTTADRLRWNFQRTLVRAKLPRIRFHDLRHTAATLLLGRGVHPKIVSEMLGHSTTAITLDLYSHVTPTMQREAAAIFDSVLGGAR